MKIPPIKTTRRQVLQGTSALALAAILPRCVSTSTRTSAPPVNKITNFADIPRSDYGFDTTCDDVLVGIDLTGVTVLITGCNSGLGYESMRSMAAAGAHVIGTARTKEKAEEACASVAGETTPLVCELTDMNSVVRCSNEVDRLNKEIDVLMCNAGIMALPKLKQVNVNDRLLEKQFVVNHLGHYLLTRRLLPQVEAAAEGRIVMVSSMGYTLAPPEGIQFDNLSGNNNYKPFQAYGQTKLANVLFSNELSRRYADKALCANSIHPGLVQTNLGRYMRGDEEGTSEMPDRPLRKGMKTAAQGASTQVYVSAPQRRLIPTHSSGRPVPRTAPAASTSSPPERGACENTGRSRSLTSSNPATTCGS